ncbi:DUF1990 family protein [Pseudonocardia petroleophila]|uniref:DUF1990 family protein n=1 Tax=Pseudonocardia petroleophila TaxID=37331 RepID=A0A7G7MB89_9PSEU|nr:DUF1990 family protein [Pseudonocardia petroleophila]QNG50050.1 DUF1990 family protein [Pseudonocardia petroleophila]
MESPGDAGDLPSAVPPGLRHDVQYVADGVGSLLHRRYSVVVDGADRGPEVVMAELSRDPNCAVPDAAVFQRSSGRDGPLCVGDEFLIRMPAPWDGPVRVIDVTPLSFRFATLDDHLEAGQIEFRCGTRPDGALTFEIESWARPGDALAHILYNRLPLAKEIQLTVWARTCSAVAEIVGGTVRGGVSVVTRVVDGPTLDALPAGV